LNITTLSSVAISLICILVGANASAGEFRPRHFSGLINDYSPSNVKGGPYEMHGQWSMDLHSEWGSEDTTADFIADMTMAGYAMTLVTTPPDGTGTGTVAVQTQAGVGPHTHHISLTNIMVTWNMTGCPNYLINPSKGGFQINGTVSILTGNGTNAPFETTPPSSTLQVCVTGGSEITYSNVTLVFAGPATSHFGSQAIHGVVRRASADSDGNR
jgi:hypothetical protein